MSDFHKRSILRILSTVLLLAGGCVSPGRNTPFGTLEDPPAYSPQYRTYQPSAPNTQMAEQSIRANRPIVSEPPGEAPVFEQTETIPNEVIDPQPELSLPIEEDITGDPAGPMLSPPSEVVIDEEPEPQTQPQSAAKLSLDIVKQERAGLGGDVQYDLTIRNDGDQDAENVSVNCTFEEGLQFGEEVERELQRNLGRVAAGESLTMSLTLTARKVGRYCAEFTINIGEQEAVWKSVCTDISAQPFAMEIIGPAERVIGSRAEFSLIVKNQSAGVLKGVQAELTYDDALIAKEATEGSEEGDGLLTWNLGDLQAGEVLSLQVEFQCDREAKPARFEFKVQDREGVVLRNEAEIRIVPAPGVLDLALSDEDVKPIKVGDDVNYLLTIYNKGFQDVRDVDVTLTPPEGIDIVEVQVSLGDQALKLNHIVPDKRWVYETIGKIPAEATISFRIRGRGKQLGHQQMQAAVKSGLDQEPLTIVEWTTISK